MISLFIVISRKNWIKLQSISWLAFIDLSQAYFQSSLISSSIPGWYVQVPRVNISEKKNYYYDSIHDNEQDLLTNFMYKACSRLDELMWQDTNFSQAHLALVPLNILQILLVSCGSFTKNIWKSVFLEDSMNIIITLSKEKGFPCGNRLHIKVNCSFHVTENSRIQLILRKLTTLVSVSITCEPIPCFLVSILNSKIIVLTIFPLYLYSNTSSDGLKLTLTQEYINSPNTRSFQHDYILYLQQAKIHGS